MENFQERSIDRLARYIIISAGLLLAGAVCLYFRNVLIYVIAAFIVSLIGRPVMRMLRKVHIKGFRAPDWLLAIITMFIIAMCLLTFLTQAIPLIVNIFRNVSVDDIQSADAVTVNFLERINSYLIGMFPALGPDFRLETVLVSRIRNSLSFSSVSGFMTGLIGSVVSLVSNFAVGAFSTIFISFFFIKDDKLISKIVCALVPDSFEHRARKAVSEISELLSRYFVGLIIEIVGVAMVDFLGLWIIARLGFGPAIGIALIAGMLNIIPYIGPLFGEVIGVVLGLILKFSTGAGIDVNIWLFALIILAIMMTAQFIDNFIYQPLIYSASIKAHPLEIFIVLLIAANIGGVPGMVAAIPAYTVIRVIASRFFCGIKAIRTLIPPEDCQC